MKVCVMSDTPAGNMEWLKYRPCTLGLQKIYTLDRMIGMQMILYTECCWNEQPRIEFRLKSEVGNCWWYGACIYLVFPIEKACKSQTPWTWKLPRDLVKLNSFVHFYLQRYRLKRSLVDSEMQVWKWTCQVIHMSMDLQIALRCVGIVFKEIFTCWKIWWSSWDRKREINGLE